MCTPARRLRRQTVSIAAAHLRHSQNACAAGPCVQLCVSVNNLKPAYANTPQAAWVEQQMAHPHPQDHPPAARGPGGMLATLADGGRAAAAGAGVGGSSRSGLAGGTGAFALSSLRSLLAASASLRGRASIKRRPTGELPADEESVGPGKSNGHLLIAGTEAEAEAARGVDEAAVDVVVVARDSSGGHAGSDRSSPSAAPLLSAGPGLPPIDTPASQQPHRSALPAMASILEAGSSTAAGLTYFGKSSNSQGLYKLPEAQSGPGSSEGAAVQRGTPTAIPGQMPTGSFVVGASPNGNVADAPPAANALSSKGLPWLARLKQATGRRSEDIRRGLVAAELPAVNTIRLTYNPSPEQDVFEFGLLLIWLFTHVPSAGSSADGRGPEALKQGARRLDLNRLLNGNAAPSLDFGGPSSKEESGADADVFFPGNVPTGAGQAPGGVAVRIALAPYGSHAPSGAHSGSRRLQHAAAIAWMMHQLHADGAQQGTAKAGNSEVRRMAVRARW